MAHHRCCVDLDDCVVSNCDCSSKAVGCVSFWCFWCKGTICDKHIRQWGEIDNFMFVGVCTKCIKLDELIDINNDNTISRPRRPSDILSAVVLEEVHRLYPSMTKACKK